MARDAIDCKTEESVITFDFDLNVETFLSLEGHLYLCVCAHTRIRLCKRGREDAQFSSTAHTVEVNIQ